MPKGRKSSLRIPDMASSKLLQISHCACLARFFTGIYARFPWDPGLLFCQTPNRSDEALVFLYSSLKRYPVFTNRNPSLYPLDKAFISQMEEITNTCPILPFNGNKMLPAPLKWLNVVAIYIMNQLDT
ncbi:hypothetical protein JTE90_027526 [Oedothorax gibbosus]|uniref:Uncharacterized protein n=1 Tax=Oedothorax gibbosus TaxID=931172 RepID=A0AAV6VJZ8_9ARAC|nr:hypothetical protein JTE90_027526 [Oedothorax gibbosus]